ncbi:hypothetical protein BGZ83_009089 [Gryganskiella cystojenkinii]|nr:hypothetical protein BGZ83_009089 [Gryganskiella cystojenkinii]
MLKAPVASSQSASPSTLSPVKTCANNTRQRRPSHLISNNDTDEGLLSVLVHGPQPGVVNAKASPSTTTVLHSSSPVKRSTFPHSHPTLSPSSRQEPSVVCPPQPEPQQRSEAHRSRARQPEHQQPPTLMNAGHHPANKFIAPAGAYFSPPCTRVGLGHTSTVSVTGSSPATLRRSFVSAESNLAHQTQPNAHASQRQRTLSGTTPHLGNSSNSNNNNPSHFHPILTLLANSAVLSTSTTEQQHPVPGSTGGLSPCWSNEDLPSPIYNQGSGGVLPVAVFPDYRYTSASTSADSITAAQESHQQQLSTSLEIRIQSPGLPSLTVTGSTRGRENEENEETTIKTCLVTTPLLDLQEQGYVLVGDGQTIRGFEEESMTRPTTGLSILTTITATASPPSNDAFRQGQPPLECDVAASVPLPPSAAPTSPGLDERYWQLTMSFEDLTSIQQETIPTQQIDPGVESLAAVGIEIAKKAQEQSSIERKVVLWSDVVHIALKEIEYQLLQEVDIVSKRSPDDNNDEESENEVIHVDFDQLMQLCTEHEREQDEWRQLWRNQGGLELDLTLDTKDDEIEIEKLQRQQQKQEDEILKSSCIIDMEMLLGCSWQQLQEMKSSRTFIEDEEDTSSGNITFSKEQETENEDQAEKEGDLAFIGPVPLQKRVQFNPEIEVFTLTADEVADALSSPSLVSVDLVESNNGNTDKDEDVPSPGWIAFKVFQAQEYSSSEPEHEQVQDSVIKERLIMDVISTSPPPADLSSLPPLPKSQIQDVSVCQMLSVTTATTTCPPLPPSPALQEIKQAKQGGGAFSSSETETEIETSSPISASSESSTSTLTSETNVDFNKHTPEDTVVMHVKTSSTLTVPVSPIQTPISPRTLELKSTRTQLQYWTETASKLRDREVMLTDRIDILVQDMTHMLDLYQDAELGLKATEQTVHELKQELVKEQQLGFASIQEAALSIQEKQVLEQALAVSLTELELVYQAWYTQQQKYQDQLTADQLITDAEVVQESEAIVVEEDEEEEISFSPVTESVNSTLTPTNIELMGMAKSHRKSTLSSILKQVSLLLVVVMATVSLSVLVFGHQHQLQLALQTTSLTVKQWHQQTTDRLQSIISTVTITHRDAAQFEFSEMNSVVSSMNEWAVQVQQSEKIHWALEQSQALLVQVRVQAQVWKELVTQQPWRDLWTDITLKDVWQGYNRGPSWN